MSGALTANQVRNMFDATDRAAAKRRGEKPPANRNDKAKAWHLMKTKAHLENRLEDLQFPEAREVRQNIYQTLEEIEKALNRLEV